LRMLQKMRGKNGVSKDPGQTGARMLAVES